MKSNVNFVLRKTRALFSTFFNHFTANCDSRQTNNHVIASEARQSRKTAFSLVELLMALLVASLLMAALAPVMTRKMGETVNVNGVGNYERQGYGRLFNNDDTWSVPNGVNTIKITAVGAGGAGGSTTYAYKKFNYTGNTQTFTVPNGVTKIRVYAIAGGGGGSSGGDGANVAYTTLPGKGSQEYTTPGKYSWPIHANTLLPNMDSKCAASGVTTWTLTSDSKRTCEPGRSWVNVQACGGGGGGSSYGGGSGGKLDFSHCLAYSSSFQSVSLTVGGGGGNGSSSRNETKAGNAGGIGGGGGGCEGLSGDTSTYTCYGRGSGNGSDGGLTIGDCSPNYLSYLKNGVNGSNGGCGGGAAGTCVTTKTSGAPSCCAKAGCGSVEGGAGGGGAGHVGGGGGGGGATFWGNYGASSYYVAPGGGGGAGVNNTDPAYYVTIPGGGGGGAGGGAGGGGNYFDPAALVGKGASGGGYNGTNTQGGKSPLNNNYCAGGSNRSNGQNGYLKVSWDNSNKQLFKCNYISHTNAGSGGGAGQVWIGEINVKPNETLSINIGKGGNGATSKSADGSNGGNTIISGSQTGSIITLFGGAGGNYSSSVSSGGAGAGYSTQKPWKNWTGLSVFDSSNLSQLSTLGHGADGGRLIDNNYTGGIGGGTYSIENTVLEGGSGGSANTNGNIPNALSYGAGGGGGGGNATYTNNTAGLGGNGQNGYVYLEWGEASGGGGQSGQVVIKDNIWVTAGVSKVKINIGKGGTSSQETSTNWSGLMGKKGNSGEDTIILVDDKEVLRAKGGYGGNPGILANGTGGGKGENETETIQNTINGDDGTDEQGGSGASLTQAIFPLLDAIEKVTSIGGLGGSISTSGEGKAGSGYGAGGGGGIYLNNKAYIGGKGANGMVYIEWRN